LDRDRVQSPTECLTVGQTISAKIIKIEHDTGKISLSRRAVLKEQERKTISTYMKKKDSGSLLSMGDLLGDIVLEDDLPEEAAKPAVPAPPAQPVADNPPPLTGDAPECGLADGSMNQVPVSPEMAAEPPAGGEPDGTTEPPAAPSGTETIEGVQGVREATPEIEHQA
jgi:hypothetical protein